MKVGIMVHCTTCDQMKKPVGRSEPLGALFCTDDCPGYHQEPFPGSLWPGETEEEFGYPVGRAGTRDI